MTKSALDFRRDALTFHEKNQSKQFDKLMRKIQKLSDQGKFKLELEDLHESICPHYLRILKFVVARKVNVGDGDTSKTPVSISWMSVKTQ